LYYREVQRREVKRSKEEVKRKSFLLFVKETKSLCFEVLLYSEVTGSLTSTSLSHQSQPEPAKSIDRTSATAEAECFRLIPFL